MAATALHVVENQEQGLGRPLPVKLSRIERFEKQPRRWFDPVTVGELADDIQIHGQNTPVSVCKHSTKPGVFVLIGGERRWRAFGIIAERTNTDPPVNCFIDTVNDERHHFRKAFRDNLQREDLIPADEAASYQRLYDESTSESHHAKVAEVAREAKKSISHVQNYLVLNTLSQPVKELMNPELRKKEDLLGTSTAIEIAKSTNNPILQLELAKEALDRNLGLVEARSLISRKTGKSGYGIGGRERKPSDDYKAYKVFLGSTLNRMQRMELWDIKALYRDRPDEFGDRERDTETIKLIIHHLNHLLGQVEEKKPVGVK